MNVYLKLPKKFKYCIIVIFFIIPLCLVLIIIKDSYETSAQLALNHLQSNYPNAFVNIHNKFDDSLEIVYVADVDICIQIKCSKEFEQKYRFPNENDYDFANRIADDIFECFRPEINGYISEKDEYKFRWPVTISVCFDRSHQFDTAYFIYKSMDECEITYK